MLKLVSKVQQILRDEGKPQFLAIVASVVSSCSFSLVAVYMEFLIPSFVLASNGFSPFSPNHQLRYRYIDLQLRSVHRLSWNQLT